ncbi:MAG: hypothetical protein RIB64_16490 [Arenibacter algicola]
MEFDKNDLPALDFILERITKDSFPLYSYEVKNAGYLESKEPNKIENEFEFLLSIINFYGCGDVTDARDEDHGASVEKNRNTAKFVRDGGFKKVLETAKKEIPDYSEIAKSQKELNKKIDEILIILEKQDFGQEILFNELQELKELYPKLSKKNWAQILKGKLIDLGIAQIINKENAEMIFSELTNQILRLK